MKSQGGKGEKELGGTWEEQLQQKKVTQKFETIKPTIKPRKSLQLRFMTRKMAGFEKRSLKKALGIRANRRRPSERLTT